MADLEHCQLCNQVRDLTFHHLIPRKLHRRRRFQKHFSRDELNTGIRICRLCHRGLHRTYDEMTLATKFNCVASIRADEALSRHILWSSRQKVTTGN